MKSMTGFGQASGSRTALPGCILKVEISSINRKQLEIKSVLPRELAVSEGKVRTLASQKINRGNVVLRADFVNNSGTKDYLNRVRINTELAEKIYRQAEELELKLGLKTSLSVADLLVIPGMVEGVEMNCDESELENLLLETTSAALERLLEARQAEGDKLKIDLAERLEILRKTLAEIEPLVKQNPMIQQEKLLQKLKESGVVTDPSDERFLREIVIFADKADVSEEITRLKSHFSHFNNILNDMENPVGRTLDFMVQEIFREITTLGNKAASVEVSPLIVKMKTELEKIREQVQNIE